MRVAEQLRIPRNPTKTQDPRKLGKIMKISKPQRILT